MKKLEPSTSTSLEITEEVEIKWDDVHSTQLPYGYPMGEEKVIITPGLLEILKRDWSAG